MSAISCVPFAESKITASANPLRSLVCPQKIHLIQYLEDLQAQTVVIEAEYFDRDYLAEFSAFYGISARRYPNTCRRLHYFSIEVDDDLLRLAASGNQKTQVLLREHYLGFTILKHVPKAELGRTVLRWYPDLQPGLPRRTDPSRPYTSHFLGLEIAVTGLAWQQQDTRVSACATVALWSLLQSSAYDEFHSIPSTAEITLAAHRAGSFGARVFPSAGLFVEQMSDAIKATGLAPEILKNDLGLGGGFSRKRFASICASLIRSGYPCILMGQMEVDKPHESGYHAVTCVGFREVVEPPMQPKKVLLLDAELEYLYIHDDNIGPSVRFRLLGLSEVPASGETSNTELAGSGRHYAAGRTPRAEVSSAVAALERTRPEPIVLRPSRPEYLGRQTDSAHPAHAIRYFEPDTILTAVHESIRLSMAQLHDLGYALVCQLLVDINALRECAAQEPLGWCLSAQLINMADYMSTELKRLLRDNPARLGLLRWRMAQDAPRQSPFVGLIRVSLDGVPLFDLLCDTTDSDKHLAVFCSVLYHQGVGEQIASLCERHGLGIPIRSY